MTMGGWPWWGTAGHLYTKVKRSNESAHSRPRRMRPVGYPCVSCLACEVIAVYDLLNGSYLSTWLSLS